jgi:pimeloyl-ACP methyl ester carboxylesterase
MDGWDPVVTNGLTADWEVILFDNVDVAKSGGETPSTIAEMTHPAFAFCKALGLKTVNILGFSLGGMIGQQWRWTVPTSSRSWYCLVPVRGA